MLKCGVVQIVTNYINQNATLGRGSQVGFFTVIYENVWTGEEVVIGNNVSIYPGTVIGKGARIGDNSVLGKQPHPGKTSTVQYAGALPPLEIGPGAIVGTGVVVYAGSSIGKNVFIGDHASIRENCEIGDFVTVGRGVAVENQVVIGSYSKVQTNAYITAYTNVEEHVFIAPGVLTTNDNKMGRTQARFKLKKGANIEKGARVGAGVILLPGVTVTKETFIAAGSVVTRDTPRSKLVMGSPARIIGEVALEELLLE
jgi:acetyltransferase-like isoleucine patch superfamily enzyme